jgi:hypothetical protein
VVCGCYIAQLRREYMYPEKIIPWKILWELGVLKQKIMWNLEGV